MEATRTKKITFVCQFCNAIVATTSGSKDAFEKHMEDSHNILTNLNVVMALHTMTKEEKEKLMRTKRKELEQELGVKVEIGENETTVAEELEENQPTFQYPKLKAKPNEKRSDFLRRRLSVYLIKQGFGRGGGSNMDRESPPLDGLVRNILGVHSRELLEDVQQQWLKILLAQY